MQDRPAGSLNWVAVPAWQVHTRMTMHLSSGRGVTVTLVDASDPDRRMIGWGPAWSDRVNVGRDELVIVLDPPETARLAAA